MERLDKKEDICTILLRDYLPEQPLKERKRVSTSEKGVHYVADIVPARETIVFVVDGRIITTGCKCDRLILTRNHDEVSSWSGHFIELKRGDIHHAIEQQEQSVQHAAFNHHTLTKRFARIVGHRFPSNAGDPNFERARRRFRTKYHCELERIRSQKPDLI